MIGSGRHGVALCTRASANDYRALSFIWGNATKEENASFAIDVIGQTVMSPAEMYHSWILRRSGSLGDKAMPDGGPTDTLLPRYKIASLHKPIAMPIQMKSTEVLRS